MFIKQAVCRVVAIDGKTIRRSKSASEKAVHVVTAFTSEMQLVLGQLATDVKSNEITAIPKLLEMFCRKGMIITIDATGTQMDIAQAITGIGLIISKREETGKEPAIGRNYFIYSLKNATAADLLRIKRQHWAIENNLHWMLDVTFREDDARARLENAAENLNILRKQALQLMKQETSVKDSMRLKRLRCALDIFYAFKVIGVN